MTPFPLIPLGGDFHEIFEPPPHAPVTRPDALRGQAVRYESGEGAELAFPGELG